MCDYDYTYDQNALANEIFLEEVKEAIELDGWTIVYQGSVTLEDWKLKRDDDRVSGPVAKLVLEDILDNAGLYNPYN